MEPVKPEPELVEPVKPVNRARTMERPKVLVFPHRPKKLVT